MDLDRVKSQCDRYNLNTNNILDNFIALQDIYKLDKCTGFIIFDPYLIIAEHKGLEPLSSKPLCSVILLVCRVLWTRQNLIFALWNDIITVKLYCCGTYNIRNYGFGSYNSKNFIDIINYLDTIGMRKDIISKIAQNED